MINPPVVTPVEDGKCTLIAGERRLKAMKILGYSQVEVRVMSVKDAEHKFDLEVSENSARKGWSMTEILAIGRQKERFSQIRARENMVAGTALDLNKSKVDSSKEAAEVIDVSKDTYRKMKTIEDNKHLISTEDFAEWDEGRLSTNKVFQKVKAKL